MDYFFVKFYGIVADMRLKKTTFLIVPLIHGIYRIHTADIISEPFRFIMSFVVFLMLVKLLEVDVSIIKIVIAYSGSLLVWVLSAFASIFVLWIWSFGGLTMEHEFIISVVGLLLALLTYHVVSFFSVKKKGQLMEYINYLETPLVKSIALLVSVSIILFYSIIRSIEAATVNNLIYGIMVSALIVAVVYLINKAIKNERNEQRLLKEENEKLESQNGLIQSQFAELEEMNLDLTDKFLKLESNHHAYKYAVPVLMKMQGELAGKLNEFATYTHEEKLEELKAYMDNIRLLAYEVNSEFELKYFESRMDSLDIPSAWKDVVSTLELLQDKAKNSGVYLTIYNHSKTWDTLHDISPVTFMRLLTNVVDNAIKETMKIPERGGLEVRIMFKDDESFFEIEITDHANPFDLGVLKKLGRRKNSTNGTGDGFSEIFDALDESNASFVLKEWRNQNGVFGKTVSVIFDGSYMRIINSLYRCDEIEQVMEGSEFDIIGYQL